MNIEVHIERLVLDGLPLTASQGRAVQAALEGELARLLRTRGADALSAGAVPCLKVGSIQLAPGGQPAGVGRQIAHMLCEGLAPRPKRASIKTYSEKRYEKAPVHAPESSKTFGNKNHQ